MYPSRTLEVLGFRVMVMDLAARYQIEGGIRTTTRSGSKNLGRGDYHHSGTRGAVLSERSSTRRNSTASFFWLWPCELGGICMALLADVHICP